MLFSLHASKTIWVPWILVNNESLKLSIMYWTPTPAARWKQKSYPLNWLSKSLISSSFDSMRCTFEESWRFSFFPVEKSSIISISSAPSSNNLFTRFEPMKPAPPVTITLFIDIYQIFQIVFIFFIPWNCFFNTLLYFSCRLPSNSFIYFF